MSKTRFDNEDIAMSEILQDIHSPTVISYNTLSRVSLFSLPWRARLNFITSLPSPSPYLCISFLCCEHGFHRFLVFGAHLHSRGSLVVVRFCVPRRRLATYSLGLTLVLPSLLRQSGSGTVLCFHELLLRLAVTSLCVLQLFSVSWIDCN